MTKLSIAFVLSGMLTASQTFADDCTHMWDLSQIGTDPNTPKALSGDANAAYPVFSFRGDLSLRYVIQGSFPNARFMSFETVQTQKDYAVDALFDRNIEPDPESINPYRTGNPLDAAKRDYTIEVVSESSTRTGTNLLRLPNNRLLHAFMMRIYSPNKNGAVTSADIPRVFAFDANSEAPAACPKPLYSDPYFHIPQFVTRIVTRKEQFDFKEAKVLWGPNGAIPKYLYGANPMTQGEEVMIIRLKAPEFMDTTSGVGTFPQENQVRYWSLCSQNFPKNETLGCIPDYLAQKDSQGFVTVIFGKGDAVRATSRARGQNMIEDTRGDRQSLAAFAYRNLLPTASFQENAMYLGDYLPRAVMCSTERYLANDCPSP